MNDAIGTNWHKEVGSTKNERSAVRAQYYEKLAELKKAVNEDLSGLQLEVTPVNAKSKYLFGVLASAFGMKKTYKILKLASRNGSGFNVDKFEKGDTVSIEKKDGVAHLVKRNIAGEILETTSLSEEDSPVEAPIQADSAERTSYSPDIIAERWKLVMDEISYSLGDEFTVTSEALTADNQLDKKVIIQHNGSQKEVIIHHTGGVDEGELYNNDHITALYNNEEFPTAGRAAYAASLDLKPAEAHDHDHEEDHFEVDKTQPLSEQWTEWSGKLNQTCSDANVSLEERGNEKRKRLLLRRDGRTARIYINRYQTSRNKGDWTDDHCSIAYKGESIFHNPLEAVKHVIAELGKPKERKVTPPWEREQHDHSGTDPHEGHDH